jgi:hypothetical protein
MLEALEDMVTDFLVLNASPFSTASLFTDPTIPSRWGDDGDRILLLMDLRGTVTALDGIQAAHGTMHTMKSASDLERFIFLPIPVDRATVLVIDKGNGEPMMCMPNDREEGLGLMMCWSTIW